MPFRHRFLKQLFPDVPSDKIIMSFNLDVIVIYLVSYRFITTSKEDCPFLGIGIINKMHAINAIYWIRTNVSSIAASALTTKLNARMVDINVTLLYASSNSTRSKWPNHYDSLLYQLSYVLAYLERTAGLKPATNGLECKMNIAVWILTW